MPLKNLLISINKFYIKMYLPIYNQEKINIMSISQRFDKRKNFDKSKRKKKGNDTLQGWKWFGIFRGCNILLRLWYKKRLYDGWKVGKCALKTF